MLPVNGARSELECTGSSRSLMFAASRVSVEALLQSQGYVPSSGSIRSCSISVLS
jgi:hypothetical protein